MSRKSAEAVRAQERLTRCSSSSAASTLLLWPSSGAEIAPEEPAPPRTWRQFFGLEKGAEEPAARQVQECAHPLKAVRARFLAHPALAPPTLLASDGEPLTRSRVLKAMEQMIEAGSPLAVIVVAGGAGPTGVQLANEEQLTLEELLAAWASQRNYTEERLLLVMVHPGSSAWVDKLAATPLIQRQGVALQAIDIPMSSMGNEEETLAAAVSAWLTVAWGDSTAPSWLDVQGSDPLLQRCSAVHCWWAARTAQPGVAKAARPTTARMSFSSNLGSTFSKMSSSSSAAPVWPVGLGPTSGERYLMPSLRRSLADGEEALADMLLSHGHTASTSNRTMLNNSIMDLTISLAIPQAACGSGASGSGPTSGQLLSDKPTLSRPGSNSLLNQLHQLQQHAPVVAMSASSVTNSSVHLTPWPYANAGGPQSHDRADAPPDTPQIGKISSPEAARRTPTTAPIDALLQEVLPLEPIRVTAPVSRLNSSRLEEGNAKIAHHASGSLMLSSGGASTALSGGGAISMPLPSATRMESALSDLELMALLPHAQPGDNMSSNAETTTALDTSSMASNLQLNLFMQAMGSDNPALAPAAAAVEPGPLVTSPPHDPMASFPSPSGHLPNAARASITSTMMTKDAAALSKYYYPDSHNGSAPTPPPRSSLMGLVPLRLSPANTLTMLQSLTSASGLPVAAHASPQLMKRLLSGACSWRNSAATAPMAPRPRAPGRTVLCGEESQSQLFEDDAARWRELFGKVEGDKDLLAELDALCPVWTGQLTGAESPRASTRARPTAPGAGAAAALGPSLPRPEAADAKREATKPPQPATVSLQSLAAQAQARGTAVCDPQRSEREAQQLSMLALMQASSTRHGPSLAAVASYRLMLRMLTDTTNTIDGDVQPTPAASAVGRARLTGEERDQDVFGDDAERWAYLSTLVCGDAALERELEELMPPGTAQHGGKW